MSDQLPSRIPAHQCPDQRVIQLVPGVEGGRVIFHRVTRQEQVADEDEDPVTDRLLRNAHPAKHPPAQEERR